VDKDGWPIRDPDSTYTGAVETADEFGYRIYKEAWRRGWEWAAQKSSFPTALSGSGISPISTFRALSRSSTSTMPGNTCGIQPLCSIQRMRRRRDDGWCPEDLLDHGRIELLLEWLRAIAGEQVGTQPGLAEEIGK
jgi:hypothetical protein